MTVLTVLTILGRNGQNGQNKYRTGMASRATKEEDAAFMYRKTTTKEKPLGVTRQAEERWDKVQDYGRGFKPNDFLSPWHDYFSTMDEAYFTSCPWRV